MGEVVEAREEEGELVETGRRRIRCRGVERDRKGREWGRRRRSIGAVARGAVVDYFFWKSVVNQVTQKKEREMLGTFSIKGRRWKRKGGGNVVRGNLRDKKVSMGERGCQLPLQLVDRSKSSLSVIGRRRKIKRPRGVQPPSSPRYRGS